MQYYYYEVATIGPHLITFNTSDITNANNQQQHE